MENESKMAGENNKHVISQLIRMHLTRSVFDIAVDRLLVTFHCVSRFGGVSLKQTGPEYCRRSSESLESSCGNAKRNCRPLAAE